MRPMAEVFIPVLLVGWLVAPVPGEREGAMEPCKGSYTSSRPTPEDLATVLRNHQEWLKDAEKNQPTGGEQTCARPASTGPPSRRPTCARPTPREPTYT
jgi:hypothetical protein